MQFSDELRRQHSALSQRIDELEGFLAGYDARFKHRLICQAKRPRRLLGHNGAHLLLTSLTRARFLTATIIHCSNGGLAPGMFLSARAHWEMTGLVAHFLMLLRRFYADQITEPDLNVTMARLALGRRWEIPENVKIDMTAINAITLVDSAAKLLGDKKMEEHVKTSYDFLSEFCHPNLFARLTGVTLADDLMIVDYDPEFVLSGSDLGVCLSNVLVSHALFFHAYDQCFKLLDEHEEMPTLEA